MIHRIRDSVAAVLVQRGSPTNQIARQISIISWLFLGSLSISWFFIILPMPMAAPMTGLYLLIASVLMSVPLLARRGLVVLACYVLVIGLWIALVPLAAVSRGVNSPAYQGLVVVTLCASLLLGARAALLCALASVLVGIIFLALPDLPVLMVWNSQAVWLTHAITLLACIAILSIATGNIRALLHEARAQLRERQETDIALRNREEQLRSLTAAIPDLVLTLTHDGYYKRVYSGSPGLPILGEGHLIGRRVVDVLPAPLAAEFLQTINAVITSGITQELEYQLEGPQRAYWFHARVASFIDAGEPCVIWLARDITERKLAEQQLAERELLYRRAITVANAVPYYLDYVTESYHFMGEGILALTGYSAAEITPQLLQSLERQTYMRGDAVNLSIEEAIKAARSGALAEWSCDMLIISRDGSERWLNDSSIEIADSSGRIIGSLGILQDITERKRSEDQLRQAQKLQAVGQLAGGLAHDFNNLLTVILNYSTMLIEQAQEQNYPAWLSEDLSQIQHAGERAAALTGQLLAFSRRQVLQPQILQLNDVLARISPMIERLLGVQITLVMYLEADLGLVRVDAGQIEQVIINLIVNARDSMPNGGVVAIETRNLELDAPVLRQQLELETGQYVAVSVADTGIGMTPEVQVRIFEPFFTTKESGRGTGLGLATAHGIVKQSGGQIGFESVINQGTTFTIYLPLVANEGIQVAALVPIERVRRGHATILLVDDDLAVQRATRHTLERQGYHVIEAQNDTAEDVCLNYVGRIDLLLTDIMMPGINGVELAERLQVVRPDMQVLYMSGYADRIEIGQEVLSDTQSFIQKPFTPQILLNKIYSMLEQSS